MTFFWYLLRSELSPLCFLLFIVSEFYNFLNLWNSGLIW
jgi:hypothetical protein